MKHHVDVIWKIVSLQCCNTVGWMTGKTSGF